MDISTQAVQPSTSPASQITIFSSDALIQRVKEQAIDVLDLHLYKNGYSLVQDFSSELKGKRVIGYDNQSIIVYNNNIIDFWSLARGNHFGSLEPTKVSVSINKQQPNFYCRHMYFCSNGTLFFKRIEYSDFSSSPQYIDKQDTRYLCSIATKNGVTEEEKRTSYANLHTNHQEEKATEVIKEVSNQNGLLAIITQPRLTTFAEWTSLRKVREVEKKSATLKVFSPEKGADPVFTTEIGGPNRTETLKIDNLFWNKNVLHMTWCYGNSSPESKNFTITEEVETKIVDPNIDTFTLQNGDEIFIERDKNQCIQTCKKMRPFLKSLTFLDIQKLLLTIQTHQTLTKLYLTGVDLSAQETRELVNLLRFNKRLNTLGLTQTGLSAANAKLIIEAAEQQGSIRRLFLPKQLMDGPTILRLLRLSDYPQIVKEALLVKKNAQIQVPSDYVCSITLSIFFEPVLTTDGETYEKSEIEKWFTNQDTSPKHGTKLESKNLLPNRSLKRAIDSFLQENPQLWFEDNPSKTHVFMTEIKKNLLAAIKYKNENAVAFIRNDASKCQWLLVQPLEDGQTILHMACRQSNTSMLKTVLGVIKPYLFTLSEKHNVFDFFADASEHLSRKGAELIANYFKWQKVDYQKASLEFLRRKHSDALEACIQVGNIDIDKKINGETLLILAIREKSVACARKLIEMGADVKILTSDGKKPMALAKELLSKQNYIQVNQAYQKSKIQFIIEPLKNELQQKTQEIQCLKNELEKLRHSKTSDYQKPR